MKQKFTDKKPDRFFDNFTKFKQNYFLNNKPSPKTSPLKQ